MFRQESCDAETEKTTKERGRVEEKVREREKGRRRGEREREGGESDIYARETQKDRKCVL